MEINMLQADTEELRENFQNYKERADVYMVTNDILKY